jgi:hypothetical protein
MKKLDKLNLAFGSVEPPSTSGARIQPFILSITLLSLFNIQIPSALDPSSLPLVRSLHLSGRLCQPVQLLLPQLDSLNLKYMRHIADINLSIQQSTSITSLSIYEGDITRVDEASRKAMKEKIVELRLQVTGYGNSSDNTLASIINESRVMKKVIFDGSYLSVSDQAKPKLLETLKVAKAACKKKEIELWKENFDVGNGKVDLEK